MKQANDFNHYMDKKTKFKDWESVFTNPMRIKIETLRTGTIVSKISSIMNQIDFSEGQDMPIIGKCVDIMGDGSFWAISTPGHTKGHISYLIKGKETQALVTGDVCISKKGFGLGVETGKNSLNIEEVISDLHSL